MFIGADFTVRVLWTHDVALVFSTRAVIGRTDCGGANRVTSGIERGTAGQHCVREGFAAIVLKRTKVCVSVALGAVGRTKPARCSDVKIVGDIHDKVWKFCRKA